MATNILPSLLLLPAPPQPSTRIALHAAYHAPLTAVLTKLKQANGTDPTTLVVAVASPILGGPAPRAKTIAWKKSQSLLAGLYTLIAVICAREGIATAVDAGSPAVDVSVLLVDHNRKKTYYPDYNGGFEASSSSVLDLAAFASKVHPWKTVFHPSTEAGYELLKAFLKFAEGKCAYAQSQLVAVEGGVSLTTGEVEDGAEENGFGTVCLGGTFDHLHPGHKLLLHAAVLLLKIPEKDSGRTCTLIVGISGDELLTSKKYAEELQPWDARARNTLSFLATLLEYNTRTTSPPAVSKPDELVAVLRDGTVVVRCVNIHDPFGPTISEEDVDAIVVSAETRSGGLAINERRAAKEWKTLKVYEIDVLDAREITDQDNESSKSEDFSAKISSTAIRQLKAEARLRS
ncbi:hypothetical protein G7046_g1547 [Stylonectria norvegica]|nr:hypothetical protein G7046_g1547 [Stylonectria norvegica]